MLSFETEEAFGSYYNSVLERDFISFVSMQTGVCGGSPAVFINNSKFFLVQDCAYQLLYSKKSCACNGFCSFMARCEAIRDQIFSIGFILLIFVCVNGCRCRGVHNSGGPGADQSHREADQATIRHWFPGLRTCHDTGLCQTGKQHH